MNSQDQYEQLKRRNRRRLVGTVVLVIIAVIILVVVLNRRHTVTEPNPELTINGMDISSASSPITASNPLDQMASVPIASDVESSAVVGAAAVAGASETSHQEPSVTMSPATGHQQPPVTPSTKFAVHIGNEVSEKHPKIKSQQSFIDQVKKNSTNSQHVTKEKMHVGKNVDGTTKKAEITKNVKQKQSSKPVTVQKKAVKPEPSRDKSYQNKNRGLSPEDILNNRAATTIKKRDTTPAHAPTERHGTGNKVLIQVGAYLNEQQAHNVQKKLSATGVATHVMQSQTSKGVFYRVRTQTYGSQEEAQHALSKIKGAGLGGLVIAQ